MKKTSLAVLMSLIILALVGCGGDGSSGPPPPPPPPQPIITQIFSNPVYDGDIQVPLSGPTIITQGMTASVQSLFAGIDPVTGAEYRAFLDFPLGGIPGNAVIESAILDIVIDSIDPPAGTIPIRIDLVSFQPPTLIESDFDPGSLQALAIVEIVPPINSLDVNNHVAVDVTSLMVEAQARGLSDFQVRILEDLGAAPGLIQIDDTTGANRSLDAPLLQVKYF